MEQQWTWTQMQRESIEKSSLTFAPKVIHSFLLTKCEMLYEIGIGIRMI